MDNQIDNILTKTFGKEEISKTFYTSVNRQEVKQKAHTQISYKGNPNKLEKYVFGLLEDLSYNIFNPKLKTQAGGFGEQVVDIDFEATAVKMVRIKGETTLSKANRLLFIPIFGLFLLFLYGAIQDASAWILFFGIIFLIGGGILYYLSPKIKKYWYKPGFVTMWIDGSGTAYLGTKARKLHDSGENSARGEHLVQTAYLEGDMDVIIGYEEEVDNKNLNSFLLREKEQSDYSLITVIKATFKKQKELEIGDKNKYDKLPENKQSLDKIASNDLKELREKLNKFSGTH